MVQVDVFWAYGLGATLAVAGARQLLARRRALPGQRGETSGGGLWEDPHLLRTLLFLALVFAPSGIYLVWSFPSWETMHAGGRDMPGWLIAAFAITNVTQGLLAYVVVDRLLARGRSYLAYLQVVGAYLGMFFVLVHGWDGKGYQRFFSATHDDFMGWTGDWQAWLGSDVAITLYAMGAVLVPALLILTVRAVLAGRSLDGTQASGPGAAGICALTLATVFGAGLGLAVAAHLAIAWAGVAAGVPLAVATVGAALLPGGPVHRLYRLHHLPVAGESQARAPRRPAPDARAAPDPTAAIS